MLKILIAEDEEPIANLIKMNLRKAGYHCIWASDGGRAADLMDSETWITPADAVAWGFATEVLEEEQTETPSQSARAAGFQALADKPKPKEAPPQSEEKTLSTFLSALTRGGKE